MKLSKLGQVKLMAFPDFVIQQAYNELKKANNLKDPFAFLMSRCCAIAKSRSVDADFAWVDSIRRTLKLDGSSSPVLQQSVQPAKVTKINPYLANLEIIKKYGRKVVNADAIANLEQKQVGDFDERPTNL